MLKQLSQPSFVNGFARSRGESVRSDLWPSICLCPMLGIQGSTLYNIAGNTPGQTWGGATTWGTNCLKFVGDNDNSYINTGISFPFPTSGMSVVVSASHNATQPDTNQIIVASWTIANWSFGYFKASKKFFFEIGKSSGTYYRISNTAITSDKFVTMIATANYGVAYPDTYLDGILDNGATGGTVGTPRSSTSSIFLGLNSATATTTNWAGSLYNVMVYPFVLTQPQILALTADPLLPLRRKKQWSMYVPSTPSGVVLPVFMNHYRNQRIA